MKVKIHNATWEVKEVSEVGESGDNSFWGETDYSRNIMEIKKDLPIDKKRDTLIHELMHAYFYEYGHMQNNKRKYHYEEVCNLMAMFADDIVNITNKYFNK